MICIYHSKDMDGYSSGAIVKKKYPDATLMGYDYGQSLPFIPHKEDVIMIDVSLPMPQMIELAKRCKSFTWIDHHKSAIMDFVKSDFLNDKTSTQIVGGHAIYKTKLITAVLQDGIAACEIAWNYLFGEFQMPKPVHLLGIYDTWRNADEKHWENNILPFQFGMRMECTSAETFPMDLLNQYDGEPLDYLGVRNQIDRIITNGKTILAYQAMQNERLCKFAFQIEFEGLRAICVNAGGVNSDVFKSVYDESKHDILMPFFFNGKQWIISLYTLKENIDCSALAKKRGGGGHKKAAGFSVTKFADVFGKLFN